MGSLKIGLSLSGGGVRAAAFHAGVLSRLASESLLESVNYVSSVSGGSIAVALVFSASSMRWPASNDYVDQVVPSIRLKLTESDISRWYLLQTLISPLSLLHGRAHILADVMRKRWQVSGSLSSLPDMPVWAICATCYETGKSWRFVKTRMGDYVAHYVLNPEFSLPDAVAASAAYPGLIGPLRLQTSPYTWSKFRDWGSDEMETTEPEFKVLHLWDGGVYDNLACEAMFRTATSLREEVDFLIVSDASAPCRVQRKRWAAPVRLVEIATDQVRGLRSRAVVSAFESGIIRGVFLRMGNSSAKIIRRAGVEDGSAWKETLSEAEVAELAQMPTTLRKLSHTEWLGLLRHGYEVADATLVAYQPALFSRSIPPAPLLLS